MHLDDTKREKARTHLEAAMNIAHEYRSRIADEDSIDLIFQLDQVGQLLGIQLDTETDITPTPTDANE